MISSLLKKPGSIVAPFLLALILTGCERANLGEAFSLQVGESKTVAETDLRVSLQSISVEDCQNGELGCINTATLEWSIGDTEAETLQLIYLNERLVDGDEITSFGRHLSPDFFFILVDVTPDGEGSGSIRLAVSENALAAKARWDNLGPNDYSYRRRFTINSGNIIVDNAAANCLDVQVIDNAVSDVDVCGGFILFPTGELFDDALDSIAADQNDIRYPEFSGAFRPYLSQYDAELGYPKEAVRDTNGSIFKETRAWELTSADENEESVE